MKKIVIISGATKGLGLAISSLLVESGYLVVGVSRNNTDEFNKLMTSEPDSVFFHSFDFSETKSISTLVKKIERYFGIN